MVLQRLKSLFKKEISLHRVRDHITIREGSDTITLYVDKDANTLIRDIRLANREIQELIKENNEEKKPAVAMDMAKAIFGIEQAQKLLDFYHGSYECVITICGMYFGDSKYGLGKKITKAQKRNR